MIAADQLSPASRDMRLEESLDRYREANALTTADVYGQPDYPQVSVDWAMGSFTEGHCTKCMAPFFDLY